MWPQICDISRQGNFYWPQGAAEIDDTHKTWKKDVWIGAVRGEQYVLVVAAVSTDLNIAVQYYYRVADELGENAGPGRWVPIEIHPHRQPPGLIELDRVVITRMQSATR